MGALIMTHSDDLGLVVPPKLAPIHVAVVPIFNNEEQFDQIKDKLSNLIADLRSKGLTVKFDDDDQKTSRLEICRI
jgi:prolyl-tRNA synthetase